MHVPQMLDTLLHHMDPYAYDYVSISNRWQDVRTTFRPLMIRHAWMAHLFIALTDLKNYIDLPDRVRHLGHACTCMSSGTRECVTFLSQVNMTCMCCSSFVVSRNRIQQHPREVYQLIFDLATKVGGSAAAAAARRCWGSCCAPVVPPSVL